jgi:hypothetical protein
LDAACKLSPCPFAKVASGQITELPLCAGTYRIQQIVRKPLRAPGTLGLANCEYQAKTPFFAGVPDLGLDRPWDLFAESFGYRPFALLKLLSSFFLIRADHAATNLRAS